MEFLIVVGIIVGASMYLWSLRPDTSTSLTIDHNDSDSLDDEALLSLFKAFLRRLGFEDYHIRHYVEYYPVLKDKCHEVINTMPEVASSLEHISPSERALIAQKVEMVFTKHIQKHMDVKDAVHAANTDMYGHVLSSYLSEEERELADQEHRKLKQQEAQQYKMSPLVDETPVLVPTLSYGENIELDKHPMFSRMVTREHMRICCLGESVPVKANVRILDIMERLSHPYPQIKDARVFLILNTIHFIPKED